MAGSSHYQAFSRAIHHLTETIDFFKKQSCAHVYVICTVINTSCGSVDVPASLNCISYVGKSKNTLQRASSHFPSPKKVRLLDFDNLDKKTEAIIRALCSENQVAVVRLDCCDDLVSFAVESALISAFRSQLTNSYAGHRNTLPEWALGHLEAAAIDFIGAKLSLREFDLVF